jgi:hypothetical protein
MAAPADLVCFGGKVKCESGGADERVYRRIDERVGLLGWGAGLFSMKYERCEGC